MLHILQIGSSKRQTGRWAGYDFRGAAGYKGIRRPRSPCQQRRWAWSRVRSKRRPRIGILSTLYRGPPKKSGEASLGGRPADGLATISEVQYNMRAFAGPDPPASKGGGRGHVGDQNAALRLGFFSLGPEIAFWKVYNRV
jgi:hypothetical protein